MKISIRSLSVPGMMLCSMLLTSTLAVAAPIKTYQVTGPVLEVTDTTITVEKDKEKWQIARDKETKVTGELKPGSKATIQYRMTATTVEAKADTKADKGEAKGEAKTDAKGKDKPAKK
ncbi:MAG: hypothetical protein ABIS92_10655 [Polyangia bacterium]